jgi:hypothetical protein
MTRSFHDTLLLMRTVIVAVTARLRRQGGIHPKDHQVEVSVSPTEVTEMIAGDGCDQCRRANSSLRAVIASDAGLMRSVRSAGRMASAPELPTV